MLVDDFEPWRRFMFATIQRHQDLQVIGEASDGLVAIEKAKELQPDLILMDIGLPGVGGIQATRQIRGCSPNSKILIVTAQRSSDIAMEAFRSGAHAYLVKSHANRELMAAVKAVLQGERFASAILGLEANGFARNAASHL